MTKDEITTLSIFQLAANELPVDHRSTLRACGVRHKAQMDVRILPR